MSIPPEEWTNEERRAIRALHAIARRWPKTLWLFSASGSLEVMRRAPNGERTSRGEGVNPDYFMDTVDIPNDGGDW